MVPSHEHVASQRSGALEEHIETHPPVALDARIRCLPGRIHLSEMVHDLPGELIDVIEHVIRNVELRRDPAGVLGIRYRAATRQRQPAVGSFPLLQGHFDDVVTLIEHERGGNRAVNPTRHRN